MNHTSDSMIANTIKIHPFFVGIYKIGVTNYSFQDCITIISLIKDADLKFKGVIHDSNQDLLKDLVLRILY